MGQKTHVLVVDDAFTNRLLVTRLLESLGYAASVAVDGAEAIAHAAATRFDVIIMDVEMPSVDGMMATRTLRERGDQTPILAFTANDTLEGVRACRRAGMTGLLRKPTDPKQLRAAMATVLGPDRIPSTSP